MCSDEQVAAVAADAITKLASFPEGMVCKHFPYGT